LVLYTANFTAGAFYNLQFTLLQLNSSSKLSHILPIPQASHVNFVLHVKAQINAITLTNRIMPNNSIDSADKFVNVLILSKSPNI
jgi:hypothetical protein